MKIKTKKKIKSALLRFFALFTFNDPFAPVSLPFVFWLANFQTRVFFIALPCLQIVLFVVAYFGRNLPEKTCNLVRPRLFFLSFVQLRRRMVPLYTSLRRRLHDAQDCKRPTTTDEITFVFLPNVIKTFSFGFWLFQDFPSLHIILIVAALPSNTLCLFSTKVAVNVIAGLSYRVRPEVESLSSVSKSNAALDIHDLCFSSDLFQKK